MRDARRRWRITVGGLVAGLVWAAPTSRAFAAITIFPSGATATAAQTSATSVNWAAVGTEKWTWAANEWLDYSVDGGATGGLVLFSLTAINHNSATAPGLPAGYAYTINVNVDGVFKTSFTVPGSTTTYQTGKSAAITLPSGLHTIRFTWTNDVYQAGVYDSNIQVRSVAFTPPPPPTISAVAPADGTTLTAGTAVSLSITATHTQPDPIQYQFLLDGTTVLRDWSTSNTAPWTPSTAQAGLHTLDSKAKDSAGTTTKSVQVYVVRQPVSPQ